MAVYRADLTISGEAPLQISAHLVVLPKALTIKKLTAGLPSLVDREFGGTRVFARYCQGIQFIP